MTKATATYCNRIIPVNNNERTLSTHKHPALDLRQVTVNRILAVFCTDSNKSFSFDANCRIFSEFCINSGDVDFGGSAVEQRIQQNKEEQAGLLTISFFPLHGEQGFFKNFLCDL